MLQQLLLLLMMMIIMMMFSGDECVQKFIVMSKRC